MPINKLCLGNYIFGRGTENIRQSVKQPTALLLKRNLVSSSVKGTAATEL